MNKKAVLKVEDILKDNRSKTHVIDQFRDKIKRFRDRKKKLCSVIERQKVLIFISKLKHAELNRYSNTKEDQDYLF